MKAEKKKLAFGGGLVIYITVLLTLIFVALVFWWHYLACYEESRIAGVMDTYMEQQLPAELAQEINLYSAEHHTGYQSVSEIYAVLTEALSGDDWYYEEIRGARTAEQCVYGLYRGETAVGEVVIAAGEPDSLNMGFEVWQKPDATFDFAQFGDTITITVPYGCTVYVNGAQISEDEVVETIGLYPQLADYETLIAEPNQLLVYRLDEVFTDLAVEYSDGYTMMKGEDETTFYALPVCGDEMAEHLIEYCKGFVRAHVEYTANHNALWAVQQYLVPDSDLYRELTDASSGLNWGHGVNAVINMIDVKNFVYYGNVITCDASYSMTRDDGDRSEVMHMLLVQTNLGWRVISREIT